MTTFNGKDLTIRWKEYVDAPGDDLQNERQYRVEFTCGSGTVVKYVGANENYGTDTDGYRQYQCTLTFEENRQFGLTRSPTINVYTQDAWGDWTAPALTVNANNPQSTFGTAPTVTNTVDGATLKITKPSDTDVAGYLVYMDTTNPPTKDSAHLVYDGPNTAVSLVVSDYTTRYVQVAPYDQFGQDSLTYSSVLSFAKQPTNVQGFLTNEAVIVAADSSGTVSSFSTASGNFKVYDGPTDVSSSCTFSVFASSGVTVSINSSGAYSASAMSADNGTATFRAVYGTVTIDKIFTIAKAKAGGGGTPGTAGADAKLLQLISDRQIIAYDSAGTATPTTQTTTFTTQKQNTTATVSWSITDAAGVSRTPVTSYLSASTGDSVTMTESQFASARNSTSGVIVTATATDGVTLTDKISVVRVQQGATGATGPSGSNGLNNAVVYLYKRSASAPALPTTTSTYTFATGALTGQDNGWTQGVPAGSNPLYVTVATASSAGTTDTIASSEWASAVIMAQDGATGSTGAAGTNVATVFLYQRSASTPSVPSVTTTYNFSSGALTGVNNGWSQTVPTTNGNPCYVTTATALSTTSTDTIANSEWASPTILAQDGAAGANGTNGLNNATVFLFQRSASTPSVPSVSTVYTFSTNALSGVNNGWSQSVPSANGNPCYVTVATASSNSSTDNIGSGEWSSPTVLSQDGAAGATGASGAPGLNSASVFLYQRSALTPSVPSVTTTYTFSTGVLSSINNGWSQTVPAANGNPCYVTSATAASTGSTDTIANTEWASPTILVQDGATGATGPSGPTIGLTASAGTFTYVDGIPTDSTQSITFTATRQNTSETVNFTSSPSVTLTGSGLTRSLSLANFDPNSQVTVTATGATSGASTSFTVSRQNYVTSNDSIVPDSDWNWDFGATDLVRPWRNQGSWNRTNLN